MKGTDGADVLERARALGAVPVATEHAGARSRVSSFGAPACGRRRGRHHGRADLAVARSFETEALPPRWHGEEGTSAADTRAAAAELARRGVELILFAGGDGTARDIHDVVGERVPILGIPTGVKMHSGVFATTPESAGDVVASFIASLPRGPVREAEIVDIDEDAVRADRIATHIYGAACVPDDKVRVQGAKLGVVPSDEVALDAVCAAVADSLDPRRIYVLGPGTTMRRVMRQLGLVKTLLGVDAVRAGRLLGSDLGERELLELIGEEPVTLLIGVVGGQGALFGRGNQQLSPAVLRRIGAENIEVIAGLRKLLALDPPLLHVDTGDPAATRNCAATVASTSRRGVTSFYRVAA